MSEVKWTPGPWTTDAGKYEDAFTVFGADNHRVAEGDYFAMHKDGRKRRDKEREVEELDANAHLIASAPELYSVLDKLLKARWMVSVAWAPSAEYEALCEEASAALAKARGEQA